MPHAEFLPLRLNVPCLGGCFSVQMVQTDRIPTLGLGLFVTEQVGGVSDWLGCREMSAL